MEEILEKEMPPEEENELANVKPEITFDDFKKLDIRIGTVEKVEAHPNADKLWLLDVNFGGQVMINFLRRMTGMIKMVGSWMMIMAGIGLTIYLTQPEVVSSLFA